VRRSRRTLSMLACAAVALAGAAGAGAAELTPTDVMRAAQRGAGALARDAVLWRQENACVACHVHGEGLEALSAAAAAGYSVSADDVAALATEAAATVGEDGYIENDYGAVDAASYVGAGLAAYYRQFGSEDTDVLLNLGRLLVRALRPEADGSFWEPESERGPLLTGRYLVTAKSRDVMQAAFEISEVERYLGVRYEATIWAVKTPAESVPDMAVRLEWLARSKSPSLAARRDELTTRLLALQNEDGGWGLAEGDTSSPFATAAAVWSLARSGTQLGASPVQRATAFLLGTQEAGGSWRDGGATLSYAATAWSVRALAALVEAPPGMATELTALYDAAKEGLATGPAPTIATIEGAKAVVLADPPALQWGVSGETTLMGSAAAALSYMGEPSDYAHLLGTSGGAFAIRWPQQGYRVDAATLSGREPVRRALEALGRRGIFADAADTDFMWDTLTSAIDAGRPCVFRYANAEHGLAVGYDPSQRKAIGYLYGMDPATASERYDLGALEYIVDFGNPPAVAPDPTGTLASAVENAVRDSMRAPEAGMVYGPDAYGAWAASLLTAYEGPPPDIMSHKWALDVLIDSRMQATAFLREAARATDPRAATFLLRAAAEYDRLLELLDSREFSLYTDVPGKLAVEQALATTAGRETFANLLLDCRDVESSAIEELKMALRGLGRRRAAPM